MKLVNVQHAVEAENAFFLGVYDLKFIEKPSPNAIWRVGTTFQYRNHIALGHKIAAPILVTCFYVKGKLDVCCVLQSAPLPVLLVSSSCISRRGWKARQVTLPVPVFVGGIADHYSGEAIVVDCKPTKQLEDASDFT
jgi:hypothetical protein